MTTDDTDSPPPDVPTRDAGRIAVKKTSPFGAVLPGGFRERLAMALKTRKADVLDAAAASYRGTYRSTSDYLARTLAEHMPEFLHWIFECIDYRKALRMYEGGQLAVALDRVQGKGVWPPKPRQIAKMIHSRAIVALGGCHNEG